MIEAIEIASEDLTAHVLFEPLSREDRQLPSHGFIVEVVSAGFVGVNREVWFEREALNQFLNDLHRLLDRPGGTARLASMSPGEVDLTLTPHARDGSEFAVDAKLKKFDARLGVEHAMSTKFLADRESIQDAIEDFRDLLT